MIFFSFFPSFLPFVFFAQVRLFLHHQRSRCSNRRLGGGEYVHGTFWAKLHQFPCWSALHLFLTYHPESLQNDDGPDVRAGSGDILLVHATETERKGMVLKLFTYCLIFLSLERSEFISHLKADFLFIYLFLCVSGIKWSQSGINSLSACACSSHVWFVVSLYWLISAARQLKNTALFFFFPLSRQILFCTVKPSWRHIGLL